MKKLSKLDSRQKYHSSSRKQLEKIKPSIMIKRPVLTFRLSSFCVTFLSLSNQSLLKNSEKLDFLLSKNL